MFPLIEVEDGQRWKFSIEHPADPVEPYIRRQGRFKHLTDEQIRHVQAETDARYARLEKRVKFGT